MISKNVVEVRKTYIVSFIMFVFCSGFRHHLSGLHGLHIEVRLNSRSVQASRAMSRRTESSSYVNGMKINVFNERDPVNIDWSSSGA